MKRKERVRVNFTCIERIITLIFFLNFCNILVIIEMDY